MIIEVWVFHVYSHMTWKTEIRISSTRWGKENLGSLNFATHLLPFKEILIVNTNRCLLLNRQLSVGQDHFLVPKQGIVATIEILKLTCFGRARGGSFECPVPNCWPRTQIEYWVHFVFSKDHHDSLAIMQPVIKQYNPNLLLMRFWNSEGENLLCYLECSAFLKFLTY